ncbi:hypothetical protein F2Q70_00022740 [Brassica cretica]|uniref:Malectin-like domain-containing protein n=1 Tax=Brassica cretica TaxID=69181 RepID=A0A8S9GIZ7_BRACR|nr:hypothetical protein F2Q70_00022740 [Brassica cretica]
MCNVLLGFISLDCGSPPNEPPYNDVQTGLTFSTDNGFVETGKTGKSKRRSSRSSLNRFGISGTSQMESETAIPWTSRKAQNILSELYSCTVITMVLTNTRVSTSTLVQIF